MPSPLAVDWGKQIRGGTLTDYGPDATAKRTATMWSGRLWAIVRGVNPSQA